VYATSSGRASSPKFVESVELHMFLFNDEMAIVKLHQGTRGLGQIFHDRKEKYTNIMGPRSSFG
jgi:hypothetical protein